MRERAALYGGHLRVEPRTGGGYRVEAVLPFDAAPPVSPAVPATPGEPA
jgi:hypothetical protein